VATTATVGCSARIVDFYTLQDGLLGISCVGERKFSVLRVWRAPDGLNVGEVSWLEPEPRITLPEEYAQFGASVRRAVAELAEHYQHVEKHFDDAAWIGARITELIPIGLNDKQVLLELDDPIARLDALLSLVPREK
jgi:Lon protease-like protein